MIKNFKEDKEITTFDVVNQNSKIDTSLVSAIRRVIHAEVPIIGILRDTTRIHKNTSMLDGDFLSHRLAFCPLNNHFIEKSKIDINDIEISLDVINETSFMKSVYLTDFAIKDIRHGKDYSPKDIFSHPNILFAKIRPKQSIVLTTAIGKGTAINDKAQFSPVSNAIHLPEPDRELAEAEMKNRGITEATEKKDFLENNGQRFYKKNTLGQPVTHNFLIETVGILDGKTLLKRSLEVLTTKLSNYQSAILTGNAEKVTVKRSEKNLLAFDFIATNENETLGNLISSYLHYDDKVSYAGYLIPHPLDNKMVVSLGLKDQNGLEATKKFMVAKIDEIKKIIGEMKVN